MTKNTNKISCNNSLASKGPEKPKLIISERHPSKLYVKMASPIGAVLKPNLGKLHVSEETDAENDIGEDRYAYS